MAIIQGNVYYDPLRSFGPAAGIAGVRVVLFDTAKKKGAAAVTDKNGSFTFFNVPKGNYQLVEAHRHAAQNSEINFLKHATISSPPVPKDPPAKLIMGVEEEVTRLDSMDANVFEINVEQEQLRTHDFYDAPVIDIPFTLKGVKKTGRNLFTGLGRGTFGTATRGNSLKNNSQSLVYKSAKFCEDGFLTVTNNVETCEECWKITDHTKGLKSGLFLAVKGCKDNTVFLKKTVNVEPNTEYLLSFWATASYNPAKIGSQFAPRIGIRITGENSEKAVYQKDFCPLNQFNIVTWVQLGGIFNSRTNKKLTVELVNLAADRFGGAFAVDDISLYKADISHMISTKKRLRRKNGLQEFQLLLTNNCDCRVENINVYFKPPRGTEIVSKTTCKGCNRELLEAVNPSLGFCIGDLPPKSCTQLSWKLKNREKLRTGDMKIKLLRCCLSSDCGKTFCKESDC